MKKLLYTYFFGYAALKWRRLFRTISIIIAIPILSAHLPWWNREIIKMVSGLDYRIYAEMFWIFAVFFPMLISWLIKPFIVNQDS